MTVTFTISMSSADVQVIHELINSTSWPTSQWKGVILFIWGVFLVDGVDDKTANAMARCNAEYVPCECDVCHYSRLGAELVNEAVDMGALVVFMDGFSLTPCDAKTPFGIKLRYVYHKIFTTIISRLESVLYSWKTIEYYPDRDNLRTKSDNIKNAFPNFLFVLSLLYKGTGV